MFGLSTTHNNIYQLAWEPDQNYQVLCQGCSTSVKAHHSCHKEDPSILQQYKEGDVLLVALDTLHHDSHYKTVLEGKLPSDQNENVPILTGCHLANSSDIQDLWKQGNLSVEIPSVCLGNLSIPILPLP